MPQPERFVKERTYNSWHIWKRVRRSKAKREALAYRYMQKIGVPCPANVELSEDRNALGLLRSAQVSMDHLGTTADIRYICYLDEHKALREDPRFRHQLIHAVASNVRKMHENDFYHLNLNFRNVLVRTDQTDPVQIYFIDATSAKIHPPAYRVKKWRMKEIAFLYKDARKFCTTRELVFFMHTYLERKKLLPRDRAFIGRLISYAQGKWGDRSSALND